MFFTETIWSIHYSGIYQWNTWKSMYKIMYYDIPINRSALGMYFIRGQVILMTHMLLQLITRHMLLHMDPPLQWCHNEHDGVSNHQPHDCLLSHFLGTHQRKHQSSMSLAFVRGIYQWPVNSLHKGPVTWKIIPFDDVIMIFSKLIVLYISQPSRWLVTAVTLMINKVWFR